MKEKRMNYQTPQTPESSLVNEDQKTWNDVEEQEYLERLSNFGEGYAYPISEKDIMTPHHTSISMTKVVKDRT